MNEEILKGKWKSLKGDAKIWWGQATGDAVTELDGNKDKIVGWIQEKKGVAKDEAEKELASFTKAKENLENKVDEVEAKLKSQYDKFTNEDIAEIKGNFETWSNKLQEKYNHTQEEASNKIKEFMSQFDDEEQI